MIIIRYCIFFASLFTSIFGYSQNKIRIACVGNSITYGAKIENRETNSYPAQLGAMLGDSYEVGNFGVGGTTLLRKGNSPYRKTSAYQKALNFLPDWVFIKLGTNDTKPVNRVFLNEYVQDYKDLIASFRQLPNHPRVVLLLPLPVFLTDTMAITASVVRERLLPMVRQVAYETGCEVINLYNLLIESPELLPDKIHPSAEGATSIAKRIYEYVGMKSVSTSNLSKSLPTDARAFSFYGFQGYEFTFKNHNAKIVTPRREAPGHPWVWRARFWGHEPQTDIALLERGFHVVYCDVAELFGNDQAVKIWDDFYSFLHKKGLSKKAVLEGMSRGAVYALNWAAENPGKVNAIYIDNPVLDMKSWPCGLGKGQVSPVEFEAFKRDYHLKTADDVQQFKGSPMDKVDKIVKGDYPILILCADADEAALPDENTLPFEQKVKALNGNITVIHKPGFGHHPHSLQNPQPIIDFIMNAQFVN